jgi:acyl carrier protein
VEQLALVLRVDPSQIQREASLMSVGLDSLMGLELRGRLEAALQIRLSSTLTWEHPSVAALATHLCRDWEQAHLARQLAPQGAGPTAAGPSDQPADDIVEIDL